MNKIVVGADGSEPSLHAIDWAATEAARREAPLHVVHVVTPWLFDVPDDPGAAQVREQMLHDGHRVVDIGAARARERLPGLEVSGEQTGVPPRCSSTGPGKH
ncbi:universal stress protein [Actinomadura sp. NAK00032]|uniref:universal stress protein n=1 Tax=Actinomadura sp. NAK00032 TaxID=2742128 RepID=UPI001592439E|nr:universal stress protein [Actinomadura sp. NAK00032]QKW37031.1 universal stress protein [Actinomadura sp. NAK00032]